MTRFHDRVLALDPIVFVPFDGPADTSTRAYDLVSGGYLGPGSGGTRSDEPWDMGFTKELVLNGTTQYWVANSTLLNVISNWLATTPEFATSLQWWRTTTYPLSTKYVHRFSNGGFGVYLDGGGFQRPRVMAVDESNTQRETSTNNQNPVYPFPSTYIGGWQLTGLRYEGSDINGYQSLVITHNSNWWSLNQSFLPRQGLRRNTSYTFAVGRNGGSNSEYFDGSVGPLAIFDRSLSLEDYEEFYNASLGTAATQALVAQRPEESRLRADAAVMRTV